MKFLDRWLVVASTGALVLVAPATAQAVVEPGLVLKLPAPTGPHRIGTVDLHLVDRSRADPYDASRRRELMISLWYPSRNDAKYPVAPYLPPKAAAHYLEANGYPPGALKLPDTHARTGAPIQGSRLPIVLFSPGNDADRSDSTVVVEELASHGYLVVTVDHTHDAGEVEFPDGRVETHTMPKGTLPEDQVEVRAADLRFVLDRVADLNRGANPDAEHRTLPAGLRGAFDVRRAGLFGTSMGGAATATAMLEDRRIDAGLSLDGPAFGKVTGRGLGRPYMLMSARAVRADIPELAEFWENLRGWKFNVKAQGAAHASYGDAEVLYPQVVSGADLEKLIGTLDPARGLAIQRAYPVAFFDRHLRHRPSRLLDGPSPEFPEVSVIP